MSGEHFAEKYRRGIGGERRQPARSISIEPKAGIIRAAFRKEKRGSLVAPASVTSYCSISAGSGEP
jgi:hypothetical protein